MSKLGPAGLPPWLRQLRRANSMSKLGLAWLPPRLRQLRREAGLKTLDSNCLENYNGESLAGGTCIKKNQIRIKKEPDKDQKRAK